MSELMSDAGASNTAPGAPPDPDDEWTRFETELEFVQCLANPFYLQWLGREGYYEDARFLRYLAYLDYWRRPEYAPFVHYPQCFHHMELLRYESFRRALLSNELASDLAARQLAHWATWREGDLEEIRKEI